MILMRSINTVINAVVFDWSGTISDDVMPVYEANMKLFGLYDIPRISLNKWRAECQQTVVDLMKNRGVNEQPEEVQRLYEKFYGKEIAAGNRPRVYRDAEDTLCHIRSLNKKVAVVSSHPEAFLVDEAMNYRLLGFISVLKGSVMEKAQALESIVDEMGENPACTLYVGDTIYDMRAANNAGLLSAAKLNGYHSREMLESERPDFVIECLSELKGIVR